MIVTQTPLRVGLVGGGTDLPGYYREHGGRVLNAAIDKYVYVIVKQRFDDDIYVNYSKKEIVSSGRGHPARAGPRGDVHDRRPQRRRDHHARRHSLGRFGARVVVVGDGGLAARAVRVPGPTGDGRGAGRAGLHDRDRPLPQTDRQAGPVRGRVRRDLRPPLRPRRPRRRRRRSRMPPPLRRRMQNELLLFYTGITRSANTILGEQSANTADRLPQLAQLRDLAGEAADGLRAGDIEALGVAMNKSWEAKRALASGVSNPQIDEAVEAALAAGATGRQGDRCGRRRVPAGGVPAGTAARGARCAGAHAGASDQDRPLGSRVIFNVHRDIWG